MAGLLDMLSSGDPGLLTALSIMSAGRAQPQRQSLAEGLLGGMQVGQQAKQAQDEAAMKKQQFALQQQQAQMQLQQLQEQAKQRAALEAWRQSIPAPQGEPLPAGPYMGAARDSQAANVPQPTAVDPMRMQLYGAMKAGGLDPLQYLQMQVKDNSPIKLGAGEALAQRQADGSYKNLFTNPKDDQPGAVKEYQFARSQGYTGSYADWAREQANLKAPKTTVNVNAEKPFINALGTGLGKQLDTGLEQAKGAQNTISTANTIRQAIDSGKVISGPGATMRVAGLQIGQALGVGGKDAEDALLKTRTVIQSMAQSELDAAQQMKGQGQITEAERDIIRRAASGDINSLTVPEVRLLADAMDRTARMRIQAHGRNVKALAQVPSAAPLMPFYQVDEPAAYGSAPAAGGVRRYNPATGRIE